jgi:hypothetical protein
MRRLGVSFQRRLTPKSGKSCGAGPVLSNSPAPLRVPALHVSGAGRGISRGLRCTGKSPCTGRWDPAVIRATLTVTVGQATTVHRRGTPLDEDRVMELWRSHRRRAGRATPPAGECGCGRQPFDISVGGTDVRRIAGHMAAAQPSWVGGSPTNQWRDRQLYGVGSSGRRQRAAAAAVGNMAAGWRTCHPFRSALNLEKIDSEAVDSAETACEGTLSAETRCSCAACHTLHDAARERQWPEHSGQRPRESGACEASRARHPWAKRGSSLRATESSEPLSALFASSSSMSSRSHTACRRIWPRTWSTSQLHPSVLGLLTLTKGVPRTFSLEKVATCDPKWRPNKVGRGRGRIKRVTGCPALIGHAMTVSGAY